ncbi:ankyrin repeat-containing domain protein [Cladorrhinum samala]|uniref:Ankyrin repeat-containing domain protein n=1 Tax=Cladorrhinum samala TaxID=585594 RepID=A0AAV9HTA9_9PEZI|nr:ankyrin repeat-containing domain protein [Cladorrhinum samala]
MSGASLGSEQSLNRSAPSLRAAVEQNAACHFVKALLDCGAGDDVRDQTSTMTLVEISAKNRNFFVTRLLLSRNFAPDSGSGAHSKTTALQHAVINGDMLTVAVLLNHGANPNLWSSEDLRTPLEIAIATKAGSLALVNLLVAKGANPNKRRSPIWYKGLESTIDAFLSPLQLAISWNHLGVLEALIFHGADVNDRASMRALFHSNVSLLQARQTPLQLAVSLNNLEAVELLLYHGANVNAPAHPRGGATAFQYAAMVGSLSIARALISRGVDVNAPAASQDGRTALEGAAENGHLVMVGFLLSGSVIVYEMDGMRAIMRARNNGHTEVVNLLQLKLPSKHRRSMYFS